jgi:hypothetical protein
MSADRTPTAHDGRRAPEAAGDAQNVPPPEAPDSSDGPGARDARRARSGTYPRSAGTEDPIDPEDPIGTEELRGSGEPGGTEELRGSGEPGGTEESVATAAGPGISQGPAPAGDDQSRERLVTEPLRYQSRWDDIQAGFVDEPRRSVADADALVAEVIDEITAAFASDRADLEELWSRGDEASTEDLRQAFRRYRSFFQRLLST